MPNLDPLVNQNNNNYEDITTNTINNFENHLLSIRDECQTMILPNLHPIYPWTSTKNYRNDRLDFGEI